MVGYFEHVIRFSLGSVKGRGFFNQMTVSFSRRTVLHGVHDMGDDVDPPPSRLKPSFLYGRKQSKSCSTTLYACYKGG
jgi:hypothetical protein